jgi:uncharacterized protein (TIGR03083 family)
VDGEVPLLKEPQPIIVVDLFPEILEELLNLLSGLSAADWARPTACSSWSVKDVGLHLLGDEVHILSGQRDGHSSAASVASWGELVTFVNDQNALWVRATRRMSPQVLIDLLRFTGKQVCAYFQSLDPYSVGGPVGWVGPDPAPVWLDVAREYTERWYHQQHIRDAVGKPGLKQRRYFAPVIEAFIRALPRTYRDTGATDGTVVAVRVSGESGGQWFLLRERSDWRLCVEVPDEPDAEVVVSEDAAWRIFTRGLSKDAAQHQVEVIGDQSLGLKVLDTVSIIA